MAGGNGGQRTGRRERAIPIDEEETKVKKQKKK